MSMSLINLNQIRNVGYIITDNNWLFGIADTDFEKTFSG